MKTPAPRLTHLAAHALLALVFLCVQQAATLHWLSHSIEATHAAPDKGVPATHHCDACLAFHALGAAAVGTPVVVAPVPLTRAAVSAAEAEASPTATRLAYRSRAPPILT